MKTATPVELLTLVLLTLAVFVLLRRSPAVSGSVGEKVDRLVRGWRGPLIVITLALGIRGALVPVIGIPAPQVHDEFSYLMMGDTFAHLRLTNPTPASWEHFETFHENMIPSYHSKYPVGQGFALAFGELLFHLPWVGVLVSTALMCGAVCWALQAFVPSRWAFYGGLLCVVRFCVLGYWVNSYWGGSVAALGGALMLGAAARMLHSDIRAATALAFSVGLMILFFSRPLEGFCFSLPFVIAIAVRLIRNNALITSHAAVMSVVFACGMAFFLYYNHLTTGRALLMPYMAYENNYATTPLVIFTTFVKEPHYNHEAMHAYYRQWKWHADLYRDPRELLFFERLRFVLLWQFYLGWALTIPFIAGVVKLYKDRVGRLMLIGMLLSMLVYGSILAFHPHYVAAATVAVFAFVIVGLQSLLDNRHAIVRAFAVATCAVALVFAVWEPASTTYIFRGLSTRQKVAAVLTRIPGQHLVLVKYADTHIPDQEIVFNGADFSSERILWARAMNAEKDAELCSAYSGRKFWNLETDDVHVSLVPSSMCEKR